MVTVTVNGLTDERLKAYLDLRAWTPMIGAMLISGWDPHTSDGEKTDIHDALIDAGNSGWMTDPLLDAMEIMLPEKVGNVRIIVSRWRSMRQSLERVSPDLFLQWCSCHQLPGIDRFLLRSFPLSPKLFLGDLEKFKDVENAKRHAGVHAFLFDGIQVPSLLMPRKKKGKEDEFVPVLMEAIGIVGYDTKPVWHLLVLTALGSQTELLGKAKGTWKYSKANPAEDEEESVIYFPVHGEPVEITYRRLDSRLARQKKKLQGK